MLKRPGFFVAAAAGLFAATIAFFSGAGTETARAEGAPTRVATAIFAGGCFWCVEADFDKLDGVVDTLSGYTGGTAQRPTYRQVTAGGTGHYEAVKVTYDPARISYEALAAHFIRTIDPTDGGGQFCDRGESYRPAIFVSGDTERAIAGRILAEAAGTLGQTLATPVLPAATFWPAEDYHQDYYRKNPVKYRYYRQACGRDARLNELWGASAAGH